MAIHLAGGRRSSRLTATAAIIGLSWAAPAAAETAEHGLSAKAASQIAALQRLKTSLSAAERKLDSRLLVTLRRREGAARVPRAVVGAPVSKGITEVDVRATTAGAGLEKRLRAVGGRIRETSRRTGVVRVRLPLDALAKVAGWREVRRVGVAAGWISAHMAVRAPRSKADEAARLEAALAPIVSEGDEVHAADVARAEHQVTGVGVKVCVLSDGVDSLAASQAAGELPAVDVLPDQEGSGDEGTAMLEIVHDLAPNAELGFATAVSTDGEFADNVRALRFQAGCDVLVDDILYFNESPFQDGIIAQAVDAVTADGALYFSSAGNEGNTLDGTSGSYENDFVDSGRGVGKFAGVAHDFDPGPAVQVFEPISDDSSAGVPVTLFWADPLGHAANDYDLYLFDADDNVVNFSQDVQDGNDDPYEVLGTPALGGSGLRLAVVRFAGSARYFQLSALRGRFSDSDDGLIARVTPGVTRGHSAAEDAFSVAAAPAAGPLPFDLEPGDPPNPSGPFPNAFAATQLPERFTSDGPRRMFFAADGSPLAAVRQKPDITAADGVSTSLEDFTPFFGTSASAPHAAAIAALVLSGNPGAGTDEVRDAFDATALDLAPAGVDGRTGHGIVRADSVLAYTGATPQPLVKAGTPTVTPVTGDGDAFVEPGETATVALPATNAGDGTATGVSVRATTGDPQAQLTPRSQSYGTIAAGETKSRNFQLALSADYPLGKRVSLSVRVTFAGALSPTTTTLTIPTGQPAATATTFAYGGPPVPIPDANETGASVTIPVAGVGYASRLTFSIDGATCSTATGATTVGLDHSFVGDLVGTLTGPGGTPATLFSRAGGSGNNLCQVVFDDAAAQPFASLTSARAPFTGTWRPAEPLVPFLSAPVDGDWKFTVVDTAARDTGTIRAVSLHVSGFVGG
jgi:subtilisin-like proprotein convertase family protein